MQLLAFLLKRTSKIILILHNIRLQITSCDKFPHIFKPIAAASGTAGSSPASPTCPGSPQCNVKVSQVSRKRWFVIICLSKNNFEIVYIAAVIDWILNSLRYLHSDPKEPRKGIVS